MTTEERLDKLERENQALKQQIEELQPKQRGSLSLEFRHQLHDWAYDRQDKLPFNWTQLHQSVIAAIKLKLGIRNIANLLDDQVPEAQKVFDAYRDNFDS